MSADGARFLPFLQEVRTPTHTAKFDSFLREVDTETKMRKKLSKELKTVSSGDSRSMRSVTLGRERAKIQELLAKSSHLEKQIPDDIESKLLSPVDPHLLGSSAAQIKLAQ